MNSILFIAIFAIGSISADYAPYRPNTLRPTLAIRTARPTPRPTRNTRAPLYRYYQGSAVDHFYTTNANEIGTTTPGVTGNYGYVHEGVAGYVDTVQKPGTIPLYRYWSASGTDHFYTTNPSEIGTITPGQTGRHGYVSEGIAGYIPAGPGPGIAKFYRYYIGHPHQNHFYTTNIHEIGTGTPGQTGRHGYVSEGNYYIYTNRNYYSAKSQIAVNDDQIGTEMKAADMALKKETKHIIHNVVLADLFILTFLSLIVYGAYTFYKKFSKVRRTKNGSYTQVRGDSTTEVSDV